jgi:hypothetical protein
VHQLYTGLIHYVTSKGSFFYIKTGLHPRSTNAKLKGTGDALALSVRQNSSASAREPICLSGIRSTLIVQSHLAEWLLLIRFCELNVSGCSPIQITPYVWNKAHCLGSSTCEFHQESWTIQILGHQNFTINMSRILNGVTVVSCRSWDWTPTILDTRSQAVI